MKKNSSFSMGLLLFLCGMISITTGYSQFDLNSKLVLDPDVKTGKLSNGLTYYIRKNVKPEKKVQLRLAINAGSILEDADQQGLAHMMEHMNFNGSTHFPKNELVSYLQSIGVQFGADLNAYTGFDETVYILPIPTDDSTKIEKGFTILEDWAGNATLSVDEIDKERGVVLEESRLGKGAGERMRNKYFPVLLNGSKYAERLPIGKDSILKNFKPESLIRFYKTWYRPNLMAVIVVGDIDPAYAEKEIIKHFSHFKNPANAKPRPKEIAIPERKVAASMVLTDKEQARNLLQVFNYIEKDKGINTWGEYRQSIVENLFNSIISQRYNEMTQQPNPPFIYGNAAFSGFIRGYRSFMNLSLLNDRPVKDAIDALVSGTESVKKFGVLSAELERAKSALLNQTERAYKDKDKTESAELVNIYLYHFLINNPAVGITNRTNFIKQILPTITLDEVNALTKKMEAKQGRFSLLMASDKNKSPLPTDKELTALIDAAHIMPVKAYEEKAVTKSLMAKAPGTGKVVSESINKALGTTDWVLNNGVTISIKQTDFSNDEILMDAWRWGGYTKYPIEDKMNAKSAATLVTAMGISDMTPTDLRKFLSGKSVSVSPYLNENDEGIEGSSSVKDFETFLQLVYLNFTQPRKDSALFQGFVNSQRSSLQNMKANPNFYFADTLAKIQYQNHPWAPNLPAASDFDQVSMNRVFAIYKELYGNAWGMHFTFIGNIDPAKVKPLIESYLGSLPGTQKENNFKDVGVRPVKGVVEATVYKGAAKQSRVNIIFTGEAKYGIDEQIKLNALTEVLNIKIIEKLREQMSGIYGGGMGGSLINRPYNNYTISIGFPCGPENVDKLTAALFTLLNDAKEKGIEQKDLDKVKETLKKKDQDQMKRNDHWLNGLSRAFIEKDDPMSILEYSQKVDALTTVALQESAKKYFNMQNYIKVVLNPEK
ncbi:MAG: insulinase family protein [Chitinophagaceae bacterium]|nr:insulinase family protein [Chitinophagaceae bacterium]